MQHVSHQINTLRTVPVWSVRHGCNTEALIERWQQAVPPGPEHGFAIWLPLFSEDGYKVHAGSSTVVAKVVRAFLMYEELPIKLNLLASDKVPNERLRSLWLPAD